MVRPQNQHVSGLGRNAFGQLVLHRCHSSLSGWTKRVRILRSDSGRAAGCRTDRQSVSDDSHTSGRRAAAAQTSSFVAVTVSLPTFLFVFHPPPFPHVMHEDTTHQHGDNYGSEHQTFVTVCRLADSSGGVVSKE